MMTAQIWLVSAAAFVCSLLRACCEQPERDVALSRTVDTDCVIAGEPLEDGQGLEMVAVNTSKRKRIPIYVTPYYNCDGPKINVGDLSRELSTNSTAKLRATVLEMKKRWADLSVEAMYTASIRLYDLGLKDEAVYWFYSAQYRSRLFQSLLDPGRIGAIGSPSFERRQAYNAFQQVAGEYINGYAFGDLERLGRTIEQVISEGKRVPNLDTIYPDVAFVAKEKWEHKNREIGQGLASLREHIQENAKEIKAMRKANNLDGRY